MAHLQTLKKAYKYFYKNKDSGFMRFHFHNEGDVILYHAQFFGGEDEVLCFHADPDNCFNVRVKEFNYKMIFGSQSLSPWSGWKYAIGYEIMTKDESFKFINQIFYDRIYHNIYKISNLETKLWNLIFGYKDLIVLEYLSGNFIILDKSFGFTLKELINMKNVKTVFGRYNSGKLFVRFLNKKGLTIKLYGQNIYQLQKSLEVDMYLVLNENKIIRLPYAMLDKLGDILKNWG
jgi:hypothetical protein